MINGDRYESLERIFKASQKSLLRGLHYTLSQIYGADKIYKTNKFLVAQGDIPVGLVAHLDTVHTKTVKDIYYDREKQVMWSPQGLGADDRAGVFAIVDIITRTDLRPTIIFTTDEEIGGIGASAVVDRFDSVPWNLNFLIELDRSGLNDSVYYNCGNTQFQVYIDSFGFDSQWGSFSDISILCPSWDLAGVNLSIGYLDEHFIEERLHVDWMLRTIDKVENILIDAENTLPFEFLDHRYRTYSTMTKEDEFLCWGCMNFFDSTAKVKDGKREYCIDCYEGRANITIIN